MQLMGDNISKPLTHYQYRITFTHDAFTKLKVCAQPWPIDGIALRAAELALWPCAASPSVLHPKGQQKDNNQ